MWPMAIPKRARRHAGTRLMAMVLNEIVVDLRDCGECRKQLKLAEFPDEQIDKYLRNAMHIARDMRSVEIDKRARKQWG